MARGFESKQVESQQQEAQREPVTPRKLTPEEAERLERRRSLELSRAKLAADLQRATHAAHRTMLQRALVDIDEQIRLLDSRR
jgi:hypothetical protein